MRKPTRTITSQRAGKRPMATPLKKPMRGRKAAALASPPTGVYLPQPGEGKRGEQGYLGYLLRQASAASRLTLERALAELGATPPQFVVLTMLKAYPGLSGADLARVALLTPQTVGVIIRNLERDGAILMTPHPVHGRIQQWTPTPRGTTLLKACRDRVLELEKRLATGIDGKAEVTIRRWLSKIATDLQNV